MHHSKRHHTDGKRQDAAQSLHLVLEKVAQGNLQIVEEHVHMYIHFKIQTLQYLQFRYIR